MYFISPGQKKQGNTNRGHRTPVFHLKILVDWLEIKIIQKKLLATLLSAQLCYEMVNSAIMSRVMVTPVDNKWVLFTKKRTET